MRFKQIIDGVSVSEIWLNNWSMSWIGDTCISKSQSKFWSASWNESRTESISWADADAYEVYWSKIS